MDAVYEDTMVRLRWDAGALAPAGHPMRGRAWGSVDDLEIPALLDMSAVVGTGPEPLHGPNVEPSKSASIADVTGHRRIGSRNGCAMKRRRS